MGLEEFAGSLLQALVVDGVVDLRTAWGLKSEASAKNAFQTQKIFDMIVLIWLKISKYLDV